MAAETYSFDRSHRLTGRAIFDAVYARGRKTARGALAIYSIKNELPHSRWGLSTSRRIGSAPKRNRIKRLIRESIRLLQHELPAGFDFLIVIRPHEPLALGGYQKLLKELCAGC